MGLPERIDNSPTPGMASALTALGADITTTGALSLTANAAAPASLRGVGQARILIDSEIMIVDANAISTTTWTILSRGAEGSTAATHSTGAAIYHVWTRDALSNFPVSSTNLPTVAMAYRNAAFSLSTGQTRVDLDTVGSDQSALFDVTTNHRYVVPVAGFYLVNGQLRANGNNSVADVISISIRKNNVRVLNGQSLVTPVTGQSLNVVATGIVSCVATDYLELFATAANSNVLDVSTGAAANYLHVVRVA